MPLNSQYNCIAGQSFSDVVLNTYGSMDYYVKGLNDNGFSPNDIPNTGQRFMWDNTLVKDESTAILINNNSVKYATLTGFGTPEQPHLNMGQYYDTRAASYTATVDGETVAAIILTQGAIAVRATLEVKDLLDSEYIFNSTAGTWTLVAPKKMAKGQTLFVLYKVLVNY